MSRFGLGLEDQEQELEIDMAIDVEDKRNALAGDSMADTPFSPLVSRAFTTAVDDSETLAEMNDVLENNDIEGIPESSRRVIQTAMESVRSRLLGGYSVGGVAVEGFASNKDLKIAIEDNKNILQRAWDAIVKFFKGIYDWFAGFFKKKKTDAEIFQKRLDKGMDTIGEMLNKSFEEMEFTEIPPLHGAMVKLPDGTIVGNTNKAIEDGELDNSKLINDARDIISGKIPVTLISSHYNSVLGTESVEVDKNLSNLLKDALRETEKTMDKLKETGLHGFIRGDITLETVAAITDKSLEDIIGKNIPITKGSSLDISNNTVSVNRPEKKEIEITINGGPGSIRVINAGAKNELSRITKINKECFNITASLTNKVFEFNKKLSTDTEESKEVVDLLRAKTQMLNASTKVLALLVNQTLNVVRLIVDLLESYIAAVAMIVKQAKKAQAK